MKKKNQEEIIITPENYEGYCALYETKFTNNDWNKKFKRTFKKFCIIGIPGFFISLFFASEVFAVAFSFLIISGIPISDIKAKRELNLITKEKYPYINEKVNFEKLEDALENAKILKKKRKGGICYLELDIRGYENSLKVEKVKDEILNENLYNPLVFDTNISEKEMQKVKTKIKGMKR